MNPSELLYLIGQTKNEGSDFLRVLRCDCCKFLRRLLGSLKRTSEVEVNAADPDRGVGKIHG